MIEDLIPPISGGLILQLNPARRTAGGDSTTQLFDNLFCKYNPVSLTLFLNVFHLPSLT
jgi:hypothetical protein